MLAEIRDLCDADADAYTTTAITRRVNAAYEYLVGLILQNDGTWEFDDTNWADMPRATFTLVNGQQQYTLPARSTGVPGAADLDNYLTINQVEIYNAAGTQYRKLKPLDYRELGDQSPDEYFGTDSSGNPNSGAPRYYDKKGDMLFLYPAPATASVALTNGLRIYYQREPDIFTTGDTTQQPAIAQPFHILLCYMAAVPYCVAYKPERVSWLESKIGDINTGLIKQMLSFYGRNEKDTRKILVPKRILYK